MKMKLRHTARLAWLLFAVLQLAACGSTQPARFYTLAAIAGAGGAKPSPAGQPRRIIGLGPVALARYLDHPGITTRSGPNTLIRAELDRWGGSLGDEVSRVLVENLGQLLAGGGYLVLPWMETAAPDYRVQLNITRFDGPAEGPVVLNAAWMLFGRERNTPLVAGEASISEAVHGSGYAALADAMSRALAGLSRRVAAEISATGSVSGK
jgi:uncharacterized lipoprotein YmbA